jgi:MOSC domain-containing protein YiiM
MGRLVGIATRKASRSPMESLDQASVSTTSGVASDSRGKAGKRQVTLLARENWQAICQTIGEELPWQTRRANLYIEGINFEQTVGQIIKIGPLKLLITQETDPCSRMREVHNGLFEAMAIEWRGGVCCQVLQAGDIYVGDKVEIIDDK